jgi:hypothetical protein
MSDQEGKVGKAIRTEGKGREKEGEVSGVSVSASRSILRCDAQLNIRE